MAQVKHFFRYPNRLLKVAGERVSLKSGSQVASFDLQAALFCNHAPHHFVMVSFGTRGQVKGVHPGIPEGQQEQVTSLD